MQGPGVAFPAAADPSHANRMHTALQFALNEVLSPSIEPDPSSMAGASPTSMPPWGRAEGDVGGRITTASQKFLRNAKRVQNDLRNLQGKAAAGPDPEQLLREEIEALRKELAEKDALLSSYCGQIQKWEARVTEACKAVPLTAFAAPEPQAAAATKDTDEPMST